MTLVNQAKQRKSSFEWLLSHQCTEEFLERINRHKTLWSHPHYRHLSEKFPTAAGNLGRTRVGWWWLSCMFVRFSLSLGLDDTSLKMALTAFKNSLIRCGMKSKFHTFTSSVSSSETWEPRLAQRAKFPVSYSIHISHVLLTKIAEICADRHLWYHHLPSQPCSRQSSWNIPIWCSVVVWNTITNAERP